MNTNPRINCHQCIYYYVTWDPAAPAGCKFHGFKSKEIPSIVVFKSSGMVCQAYTPKNSPK